jgi:hypothetical protein
LEKYLRFSLKSNYRKLVTEFTIFVKIEYLQTDSEQINQHEPNAAFPMKAEFACFSFRTSIRLLQAVTVYNSYQITYDFQAQEAAVQQKPVIANGVNYKR